MKTLVSVVITSHNHESYIQRAVKSVLEQKNEDFELEIIAVDDCSTDKTPELLKQLSDKHRFKFLSTALNSGPSTARNLGLKEVKGNWVNFLDGDDYLLPDKISAELEALASYPNSNICYCDCLIERKGKINDKPLSQLWPPAGGQIYDHLLLRNCIALHTGLIKATIAKRYLFDESLWTAEDYDFWLRIAHDKNKFLYVNKPLAVYSRGSNTLSEPKHDVFNNTLRVLDAQQVLTKTTVQQNNLNLHRSIILQNKADIELKHFKRSGLKLLQQASALGALPRYKILSLNLMRKNFWAGAFIYKLLDARSRWRAMLADGRS